MKTEVQISPKFNMLPSEWSSLLTGFLWYFCLPIVIEYLTETSTRLSIYTFSWSLLVPGELFVKAVFALLLAQFISLTRKFVPENMVTTTNFVPENIVPENIVTTTTPQKQDSGTLSSPRNDVTTQKDRVVNPIDPPAVTVIDTSLYES